MGLNRRTDRVVGLQLPAGATWSAGVSVYASDGDPSRHRALFLYLGGRVLGRTQLGLTRRGSAQARLRAFACREAH